MLHPLETVKAVTSAFGRGDAECSILHLLLSGSPYIGSRRTSLRSYRRRLTSINDCLYDTAPVAYVQLFSTLPRWLRHLKSGWRQGTSYKCFSPSNIYTVPTVSYLLITTALTWPLQSFKFQKATDRNVYHTLGRLNFDIIVSVITLQKTIYFRGVQILIQHLTDSYIKVNQWTAGSCWHCWFTGRPSCVQIRQIYTEQPPEPPTVLLWRCCSCCSPHPSPCGIHLKATPFNDSNPQLFERYILNVSLW